jgi:hypothetical protein
MQRQERIDHLMKHVMLNFLGLKPSSEPAALELNRSATGVADRALY